MKTFNTVRRGYDPAEVDSYVQELEAQMQSKNKQIEEYRQKEAAINQSVVEAKLLANKIIDEANADAQKIHQEAVDSMTDIKKQTQAMHEKLKLFQKEYNHILQQYLVSIRCTDLVHIFNDLDHFMDKLQINKPEEEPVEVTDLGVGDPS